MRNRAVRHPGRAKIFTRVDPLTGISTLFGTSCWGRTCRLAGGPRSCTDGLPVSTERSPDGRVVRARDQVANALAVARGGRSASAERMLREALGVLERRGRYAGAARAAATLSLVLQERGQTSKANDTLRQARALYEVARDVGVPGREQEDYAEARGLLRPSDAITHGSTGHVVANTAPMRALAGDVCGLLRSSDPFDETGSLPGICAWLQARLQARSVAVYRRGSMRRRLATAGPAERLDDDAVTGGVLRGNGASPTAPGRRPGLGTAIAIGAGPEPAGVLVVRWAAIRPTGEAPWIDALLSVAAVACESDLRLTMWRERESDTVRSNGLLGNSAEMQALRESIGPAASAPYPVLIEGESGVGKELVARALHRAGPRHGRRFCALNCAALTDELFEAELFGHTRGAFTGAVADRVGLFEEADRGTLFLDEVAELSPRAQAKLLRVVQEGELRRVGDNLPRRVDVRFIAATNRTLSAEATAGRFRRDLLFRLAVVRLDVPSLRTHAEDIGPLASHFWTEALTLTGGRATLSAATIEALTRYHWPGNVRELQNVIAALAVRAPRRGVIGPSLLPHEIGHRCAAGRPTLAVARRDFERRYVRAAMQRAGGRRGLAAQDLGLTRQGMAKLLERLTP